MIERSKLLCVKVVNVWWVLVAYCLVSCAADTSKCDTCKDLTSQFKEGIEKTANSNFGGGNTHWEEKKLGSFAFSETRLIEVLEYSCQDKTKECHHMLEANEEVLEYWWFNFYAKGRDEDLTQFFCQNTLKVCCPEGTFGPNCLECPAGKDRPCSGNGKCQGSGTREGTGTCSCNLGYQGEICDVCSTSRYFEEVKNETHTICTACHYSCSTSCHGAGSSLCDDCISGWSLVEGQGCVDCDPACDGCTGSGAENCVECKVHYFHDGTTCRACHKSCARNCSDDSPSSCDECAKGWHWTSDESECHDVDECLDGSNDCTGNTYCENTEGSFLCSQCDHTCNGCTGSSKKDCKECQLGYIKNEENECQDVDECLDGSNDCTGNTYCQNTDGSFLCQKCDRTCNGCSGPSNKDCKECQLGYIKNEENECQDVDECHMMNSICVLPGEQCVNTLGSYSCKCQKGFVRRNGKCEAKQKGNKKKKEKMENSFSEAKKLSNISPESLVDEIKKLGEPIKGIPINDADEEMVVMEGKFDTVSRDPSDAETEDIKSNTQHHDDL